MKLTIGKKLGLGFTAIVGLMTISSSISYTQIKELQQVEQRVIELRYPTIVTGRELLNGINSSLAALRGYMILGADPALANKMKANRQAAWDDIDQAINKFDDFARNWTVPANIERLADLKATVEKFRQAQIQVESISHTPKNIPAFDMLLTEAAPRAADTLKALTALIDEEQALAATPARKALLKNLADSRGSFAIGLASIRAYLLSGNDIYRQQFTEKWAVNSQVLEKLKAQTALLAPQQQQHWQNYLNQRSQFAPFPEQMFALRSAKDWNQANYLLGTEAAPRAAKIVDILATMKQSQDKLVAEDLALLKNTNSTTVDTLIFATIVAILVAALIAFFLSNKISRAINQLLGRAQNIAAGDLTGKAIPVNSQDELGDLTVAINEMSASLNQVVQSVNDAASEVSSGAMQVATGNSQIASGMEEQSQQVSMVSSSIEEMSTSVNEVARNSSEASAGASQAETTAIQGKEVVGQTIEGMRNINDVVTQASQSVKLLGDRGEEIGSIVTVINSIADQTNLLALNAAIEAARAGEHGRGFAVVADEVRQLAQRTVTATDEIKQSISAMQAETGQVIEQMEESTTRVQTGVSLALEAGEALDHIVEHTQNVAGNIQSIASVSEQQSVVAVEVAQNIDSIASVTEESSATTTEAAAATTQLSAKAETMISLVNQFKLSGEQPSATVDSGLAMNDEKNDEFPSMKLAY